MHTYRTKESVHPRFNDHDDTFGFAEPEDHRRYAVEDGFPHMRSVGYTIHDHFGAEIATGPTWEGVIEACEKAARAYAQTETGGFCEGAWECFWDGVEASMWTTWSATPAPEPRR